MRFTQLIFALLATCTVCVLASKEDKLSSEELSELMETVVSTTQGRSEFLINAIYGLGNSMEYDRRVRNHFDEVSVTSAEISFYSLGRYDEKNEALLNDLLSLDYVLEPYFALRNQEDFKVYLYFDELFTYIDRFLLDFALDDRADLEFIDSLNNFMFNMLDYCENEVSFKVSGPLEECLVVIEDEGDHFLRFLPTCIELSKDSTALKKTFKELITALVEKRSDLEYGDINKDKIKLIQNPKIDAITYSLINLVEDIDYLRQSVTNWYEIHSVTDGTFLDRRGDEMIKVSNISSLDYFGYVMIGTKFYDLVTKTPMIFETIKRSKLNKNVLSTLKRLSHPSIAHPKLLIKGDLSVIFYDLPLPDDKQIPLKENFIFLLDGLETLKRKGLVMTLDESQIVTMDSTGQHVILPLQTSIKRFNFMYEEIAILNVGSRYLQDRVSNQVGLNCPILWNFELINVGIVNPYDHPIIRQILTQVSKVEADFITGLISKFGRFSVEQAMSHRYWSDKSKFKSVVLNIDFFASTIDSDNDICGISSTYELAKNSVVPEGRFYNTRYMTIPIHDVSYLKSAFNLLQKLSTVVPVTNIVLNPSNATSTISLTVSLFKKDWDDKKNLVTTVLEYGATLIPDSQDRKIVGTLFLQDHNSHGFNNKNFNSQLYTQICGSPDVTLKKLNTECGTILGEYCMAEPNNHLRIMYYNRQLSLKLSTCLFQSILMASGERHHPFDLTIILNSLKDMKITEPTNAKSKIWLEYLYDMALVRPGKLKRKQKAISIETETAHNLLHFHQGAPLYPSKSKFSDRRGSLVFKPSILNPEELERRKSYRKSTSK